MSRWWLIVFVAVVGLAGPAIAQEEEEEEADPAQVAIGERLFLETRFAQYAAAQGGDVNKPFAIGDPVVQQLQTLNGPIMNPFAGQSMNCRSCHLVDDVKDTPGGGNRSYADFARQSPIPLREDGRTTTPRNSPSLVNASLSRGRPFFLHFDGEFPSAAALVRGTLTGRNYGYLASEVDVAVKQIARVIREDDGTGALAQGFDAGPYRRVLLGTDPSIPPDFRLPRSFRIDVTTATDDQIVGAVSKLIAAYVESLEFARDDDAFVGSPFDTFVAQNHWPTKQAEHENPAFYRERLRTFLNLNPDPDFVTDDQGPFALHEQKFEFGALELEGFRIFMDRQRGNCAACHIPPAFTDFGFHNTGVSQTDYDDAHGEGTFAALSIPGLGARDADPEGFLPPSAAFPFAPEPFRALVDPAKPGFADLGVWNVYQNGDLQNPNRNHRRRIDRLVCAAAPDPTACRRSSRADRLDASVALFKTPGLRDLGHSNPSFHTGKVDTLEDVVRTYIRTSRLEQSGALRNGAVELRDMHIDESDVAPLAAFLRSLNEDYE
jgi:cytochrome c peroxidase